MSLTTSKAIYRTGYQPLLPAVTVAPFPYAFRYDWDPEAASQFCLRELQHLLVTQTSPEETAAVLIEPILGEGGYVVPPDSFLRGVQTLCRELGILLILDEIQTGFGRTGRFFALEHSGLQPDILVMAKGLASGLPISALAASRSLMECWPVGSHGGTYGANAIACAAANATLRVIQDEGLVANAERMGRHLRTLLDRLKGRLGIGDVRGKGLMVATEFGQAGGRTDGTRARAIQRGYVSSVDCSSYPADLTTTSFDGSPRSWSQPSRSSARSRSSRKLPKPSAELLPMTVVIRGAYLIDGTGGDPVRDCSLVLEGRRISAIRPGGGVRAKAHEISIDVQGRAVIPGLFNCHVHLQMDAGTSPLADLDAEPADLSFLRAARRAAEMLRRGITTVRDCGAKDLQVIHLRKAIASQALDGPRIHACGRAICATGGHALILSEAADGAAQVERAALRQIEAGADFVKLMATGGFGKEGERLDYSELDVAEIRAAADAAHRVGKKVTVHAYGNQGIRNAIAAGADSVEHATFLDESTVELLRQGGTFIVPTLTNTYRVATEGLAGGLPEYMVKTAASVFPTMMANARHAYRAGVKMAIGTDAGSWLNPHTDIVTELRLRVEAGASRLDAITMGTRNSARCLGIDDVVGTLQPGKLADFVVLDGDPLEDLSAVERVWNVYKEGASVFLACGRS
jgi:imidazolonepropionase-like amidohydrolase